MYFDSSPMNKHQGCPDTLIMAAEKSKISYGRY